MKSLYAGAQLLLELVYVCDNQLDQLSLPLLYQLTACAFCLAMLC